MGYPTDDFFRHRFFYPATIAFILLPFWLVPFPAAIVLWCALLLMLVMLLPLLVFMLLDWHIPPLLLASATIFSIVAWRHTANSYTIGQFTGFTLACLITTWWMLVRERHVLAALALVGATLRAEAIFLVALALFYLLLTGRRRVVVIWAAIMFGLFLLSLLAIGPWISSFLDGIRGYQESQLTGLPAALTGVEAITFVIIAGMLVWAVRIGWEMRALPSRYRDAWMLAVGLLVILVVLPQSKDYTLVYALFPIWFILWLGRDRAWHIMIVHLFLISPWLYHAFQLNMQHESLLEEFFTPLLLAILLTYHWRRWRQIYSQPLGVDAPALAMPYRGSSSRNGAA